MKLYIQILLINILYTQCRAQNECKSFNTTFGCDCLQETLEFRCEDISITGENLQKTGESLGTSNATFNLLYIKGTDLVTISDSTFATGIEFKTIFIEKNLNLTSIAAKAFGSLKTTTKLYVTNNSLLVSGLYELLPKTEALKEVDFRGNDLKAITTGSFKNAALKELEFIRLEGQFFDKIDVQNDAFATLPKLQQLTLDNSNIQLKPGSINLSATSNSSGHVEVYLRNSNITSWVATNLILPSDKTSVWLDLIGNPIADALKYDEFKEFFSNLNNKLFIKNTKRDCTCDTVREFLKLNLNSTRVNGLVCDNIDDCL